MADSMDRIRKSLAHLSNESLRSMLDGITIADLDYIWDDLDEEEAIRIFSQLDLDKKVDLVNSLPAPDQESLVAALSVDHAKVLLEEMEPDDLTDFIQAVSQEVRDSVWKSLSEEAKEETRFLLKFDEDDAAGLMTPLIDITGLTIYFLIAKYLLGLG